ncbi:MAG: hypothetical protein C5B52_16015 [Bacteroidetes bacterium]|nr:MAG: hypothetical protein C5B52_16015 [Bacteroidota bacterium]
MKKLVIFHFGKRIVRFLTCAVALIMLMQTSCNKHFPPTLPTYVPKGDPWFSRNIYFPDHTDSTGRAAIVAACCDSISAYLQRILPGTSTRCIVSYCPCDSSLINLDVSIVGLSGQTVPPPPPTTPKPGPTGDYTYMNNINLEIPEATDTAFHYFDYDSTIKIPVNGTTESDSRVIAIIDTGLDTTRFTSRIGSLIWGLPGTGTIFSVIPNESYFVLNDPNHVQHGTAVTGIVLNQIPDTKPKIMSIRAFDARGGGSIYTVSCALSYAIKNHVNLINASWGYFGDVDSVLFKYISKASENGIPIIAAAGNTRGHHNPTSVCPTSENTTNDLSLPGRQLFYPGCFSTQFSNMVTVTTLASAGGELQLPCFYQNYSNVFVNVGVLTKTGRQCCTFPHPSATDRLMEGSSFATPVVTGRMLNLIQASPGNTPRSIIDQVSEKTTGTKYTLNGSFIRF